MDDIKPVLSLGIITLRWFLMPWGEMQQGVSIKLQQALVFYHWGVIKLILLRRNVFSLLSTNLSVNAGSLYQNFSVVLPLLM